MHFFLSNTMSLTNSETIFDALFPKPKSFLMTKQLF